MNAARSCATKAYVSARDHYTCTVSYNLATKHYWHLAHYWTALRILNGLLYLNLATWATKNGLTFLWLVNWKRKVFLLINIQSNSDKNYTHNLYYTLFNLNRSSYPHVIKIPHGLKFLLFLPANEMWREPGMLSNLIEHRLQKKWQI